MPFDTNCFINCPFDPPYEKKLLKPIAYTVFVMGLIPHICENPNNGQTRLQHITDLMRDSKYGIHDICRMGLSSAGYPRFNMPFELGLDMGMRSSGVALYGQKVIFILDAKAHRHTAALSDLAGFDPVIHKENPERIIRGLRDAFYRTLLNPAIPPGTTIWLNYQRSMSDILLHRGITEIEFKTMLISEYIHWINEWTNGVVPHVAI
jgi:hypothetical protein